MLLCCETDAKQKRADDQVTIRELADDLSKQDLSITQAAIPSKEFDRHSSKKRRQTHSEFVKDFGVKLNNCTIAVAYITDTFCADATSAQLLAFISDQTHKLLIPVIGE
jgi:hypothetical protein